MALNTYVLIGTIKQIFANGLISLAARTLFLILITDGTVYYVPLLKISFAKVLLGLII